MAADSTTTDKADQLLLSYKLKNDSTRNFKELQTIINTLADIPKTHAKTKRDLRNVLCHECRPKAHEILNLPLDSFADLGCQTDNRYTEPALFNIIQQSPNRMVNIVMEKERLENGKSQNDDPTGDDNSRDKGTIQIKETKLDEQSRSTNHTGSVHQLQTTGLDINNEAPNHQEEQDTDQIETQTTLSEQITKLKSEKEELQDKLKTKRETIQTLQTTLESNTQELGAVQRDRNSCQNQLKKMQDENYAIRKQMDELSGRESASQEDGVGQSGRDIYQNQMLSLPDENKSTSDIKKVFHKQENVSSSRDSAQEQFLGTDKDWCITTPKQVEKTSTVTNNAESGQMDQRNTSVNEQKFEKLTEDIGNHNPDLSSAQSPDSTPDSELKCLQTESRGIKDEIDEIPVKLTQAMVELEKSQKENKKQIDEQRKAEETLGTLKNENERFESERKQMTEEKERITQAMEEMSTELTQSNNKLDRLQEENTRLKAYISAPVVELESLKTQKDKYGSHVEQDKNKMDALNEKMARTESEMKQTQKENQNLIDSQSARADEMRSLKTEKDRIVSHLERAKQEKQQIQNNLDELNIKMAHTETQLKETQKENQNLIDSQSKTEEKRRTLQNKNNNIDSERKNLQQENANIKLIVDEKTVKLTEANNELDRIRKDNSQLKADSSARADEMRSLKTEKDRIVSHLERAKQEKQQIQNKLDELNTKMTHKESQLKETQKENQNLIDRQNEQREQLKRLRQQLDDLSHPKKKRVVLGLRSERSGLGKSLVDMVTKELTRRLQERLDMNNFNLTISFSETPSEITNGLQVVLCLNMSRVGTNIADTLKGMKADRDVFVMVLHHTSKENLSSLTPTSLRVTGSEVRQLGGIMDMAFTSDSGLFECDLNSNAVDKIASILKKCLIL